MLMAAMAATRLIWERKLVTPKDSIWPQTCPLRAKSPDRGLMIRIRSRYHTARSAVATWPMTVATAAPIMPHLQPKMKMGSRMMFSTAPARLEIMAKRGLPSARITGFMAWPNI